MKQAIFMIFLLSLSSCATGPACKDITDKEQRTQCYEDEADTRYFNRTGWRYHKFDL